MRIARDVSVPEGALSFRFVQSSGPGGQNVNKVATAAQLRVSLPQLGLSMEVRQRLERLAGRRVNAEAELVITAQRFRTQERNRADALDRLADLIRRARAIPPPRRATRPSLGVKRRRLDSKKRAGAKKRLRSNVNTRDA